MNKTNENTAAVSVDSRDLFAVLEILNAFKYESDEDSCMGMSFFNARLCEDSFFRIKWKLEELLKSSANNQLRHAMSNENTTDEAALPPVTSSASTLISAHDDDLARDMACFLWECSRLRHGLFTPPEFMPLVSARLREYLTSHKSNVETTREATTQTKTLLIPQTC